MNRIKALAVAVFATMGFSGCATTQVVGPEAAKALVPEQKVSRPLPNYGSMGGYRYRRFAAFAAG